MMVGGAKKEVALEILRIGESNKGVESGSSWSGGAKSTQLRSSKRSREEEDSLFVRFEEWKGGEREVRGSGRSRFGT